MVKFKTIPQAPVPTILKHQIPYYKEYNKDKHYGVKIVFVDVETAVKWAYVCLTSQIIDGDMPYIYNEDLKVKMKYDNLVLYNTGRLYNLIRPMLIYDGYLDKYNDGAILISAEALTQYLQGKSFKVRGMNFSDYKNAKPYTPVSSGDSQ